MSSGAGAWYPTWYRTGSRSRGLPTSVAATRLDDFGPTFASVLCSLGHALPRHLVGVVGGTHRDLVLHRRQQRQVGGPWAGTGSEREWVSEWVKDQQLLPANLGKTIVLNSVESWPLPRHILMDAFKTSLRVVLAHIRQVKIKIVEGVGGRVALRNFNTLWRGRKKKNSCLITNITWHCYGLYSLNSKWIWFKSITTTDTPKVINIYLNISSWTPVEQPCKIKIIYQHKESISWTVCFRGHLLKSSAS